MRVVVQAPETTMTKTAAIRLPFLLTILAPLILIPARAGSGSEWPPPSDLPEGVLAIVGDDRITERELHVRLARDKTQGERAPVRDQLVDTRLIQTEMQRRGVRVERAEVDRRMAQLEQEIRERSGGRTTIDDELARQGIRRELFRDQLEYLVGLEQLAREEFGIPEGEEVPQSKANLVLAQLREQAEPETEGLPEGIVARTKRFDITEAELGRALARLESDEELNELLRTLASESLIERGARDLEIRITEERLREELDLRRWAFARLERYPGLSYDDFLRASRQIEPEEFLQTPNFRSQVKLKEIARRSFPVEQRRKRFEETRDAYGPLRRARHLFVSTAERTESEAVERLDRLRTELDAGVPFASLVQQHSEAADRSKGGDTGYFPRTAGLAPEFVQAAFELRPGVVSAPVRTEGGFHLIQVIGVKPLPSFEKVDGLVLRELASKWLADARRSAEIRPAWLFARPDGDEG